MRSQSPVYLDMKSHFDLHPHHGELGLEARLQAGHIQVV